MYSVDASMVSPFIIIGIIGSPTGAGPPALRIPRYSKASPVDRFALRLTSIAVGSKRLEWQIQNIFPPPSSPPPGVQLSSVNELETNCQPGIQQR